MVVSETIFNSSSKANRLFLVRWLAYKFTSSLSATVAQMTSSKLLLGEMQSCNLKSYFWKYFSGLKIHIKKLIKKCKKTFTANYQVSKHKLARGGPVRNFSLGIELKGQTDWRFLNAVSGQADVLVCIHVPVVQLIGFQIVDSLLDAGIDLSTQETVIGVHVVSWEYKTRTLFYPKMCRKRNSFLIP